MPFRPRRSVLLSILAFAVILSGLIALVTTPVLADEFVTAHEVRWSPDGRWLAVGSDSGLWLFETRTFAVQQLVPGQRVHAAAFDPIRPRVAIPLANLGRVDVVDLDSQTPVFSVELALPPGESFPSLYGIDYSPDGRLLAANNAGQIALIDAETGTVLDELYIPPDPEYGSSGGIWSMRFRADSRALYAVDWSGRLLIHQFEAGLDRPQTETYQLLSDYAAFYHVDVLPDGSALLGTFDTLAIYQPGASTLDVLLEVYPPEFGLTIPTLSDNLSAIAGNLDDPALAVYGFALNPDASQIALGRTSAWTLYDRERGREVITHALEFGPVPSTEQVYALAFSPDGLRLALMGTDGGLRIVSVETGEVLTQPYQFNSGIDPRWG